MIDPGGSAEAPPVRRSLIDALPLLLAVMMVMAGTGLTGTLLGVRADIEGFGPIVTGSVLAAYYLGFLVGSLLTPSTLQRVGHVRAFAGLASLASAAVLIHVLRPIPLTWFGLRVVTGACVAGLYVVTETWLNGASTNQTRGAVLAGYMVVVTGGLGLGQLAFGLSDPTGFAAFAVASVFVSLAVVPVSLARVVPPALPDPHPPSLREVVAAAPLAPVAAALSGFMGAATIGGGTIYAVAAGLGTGGTAALVAAALVGGLVFQVPLGRWSDRTDRRRVIVAASALGAAASMGAAWAGPGSVPSVVVLTAAAGGVSFPLYALASAHLNDYLDEGCVVDGGARMVMVNGVGAIGGPIGAAAGIHFYGPGALFVLLALSHALVGGYAAYRITRRAPAPEEERSSYLPLPTGVSSTIFMLQEGTVDELYPLVEASYEADGVRRPYLARGFGAPLVLLADEADGPAGWSDVLTGLAADGVRAVAAAATTVDDVIALLHELELPVVDLGAYGDAIELGVVVAQEHTERVRSLVLVGDEGGPDAELAIPGRRLPSPELRIEDPDLLADQIADFLRHEVGDVLRG